MLKRLVLAVLLAAILFSLCALNAYATDASSNGAGAASIDGSGIGTVVYVNGLKLQTDTPPVILGDYTYVPFRAIAEALGCAVGYDDASQTVTMEGGGISLSFTTNSKQATVNGKAAIMQTPPFVVNGRTMVPVRFVAETFKSKVNWTPGYSTEWGRADNVVDIFSELPATVKPLGIGVYSDRYMYEEAFIGSDGEKITVSYDLALPQFTGLSDAGFQAELNASIIALYESIDEWAHEIAQEQRDQPIEDAFYYNCSDDCEYSIAGVHGNVLTVILEGYEYMGGAHGMPYRIAINIDAAHNMVLQLSDIFIDDNYEQRLIDEMNALRPSLGDEYEEIAEVTYLPGDNAFYFDGDALVLYYAPYEFASYAMGFVEFKVPLKDLSDILAAEYK